LIAEQKVREVLPISDRTYILKVGKVSFEGLSWELLKGDRIHREYL
jgi:ABC-type branched-subunit amino acid transport system ATPase component